MATKKNKAVQKKKNTILNLLMVICSVVFCLSGWRLFQYYLEYKHMDEVYYNITNTVIGDVRLEADVEGLLKKAPKVDMDALKSINEEIVGYILIPDTNISYPIAQSNDPYKYLNYNVQNEQSRSGAIFIDSNNDANFVDANTIIYGHNMKNNSMFCEVRYYVTDEDFFKKHSYIYIYVNDEIRLYRVFSAQQTYDSSDVYVLNFTNQQEKTEYLNQMIANSSFTPKSTPTANDEIITLSTCTNAAGPERSVAQAYLVSTIPNE